MSGYLMRDRAPTYAYVCPRCGIGVKSHQPKTGDLCITCDVRLVPIEHRGTLARTLNGVPHGIPSHVSIPTAADALSWSEGKTRGQADRGELATLQAAPGKKRLVPATELVRLEQDGHPVNWDALLEPRDRAA